MLGQLLAKVIGTQNDRELKRLRPLVDRVNSFEASIKALSDTELRGKTAAFRERLGRGEALHELLPEAFAVVREAGRRVLNEVERRKIEGALREADNDKGRACELLGIPYKVMMSKIKEHRIS